MKMLKRKPERKQGRKKRLESRLYKRRHLKDKDSLKSNR
jgi:hypothetical protein